VETPEQVLREAKTAEENGDLTLAERILSSASKRWRNEPEFKMRHARILRGMGREKKALKVYKNILKTHPQRSDAALFAAETATSLSKLRLAESLWSRALSVGVSADIATAGLCRVIWIRGRKEEAWERAKSAFIQGGSSSRILHEFLRECSPILGADVPEIDLLETGDLDTSVETIATRRQLSIPSTEFGSDSVESMAGITVSAGGSPPDQSVFDLLGDDTKTTLVDMSAVERPSTSKVDKSEIDLPDDLLDFD